MELKSGPLLEPNKIKKMISAIEDNIKLSEVDPIEGENGKKMVENAFTRLMSTNGGENSPSPGRKRIKRLNKVKPHGLTRLDEWIRREKN